MRARSGEAYGLGDTAAAAGFATAAAAAFAAIVKRCATRPGFAPTSTSEVRRFQALDWVSQPVQDVAPRSDVERQPQKAHEQSRTDRHDTGHEPRRRRTRVSAMGQGSPTVVTNLPRAAAAVRILPPGPYRASCDPFHRQHGLDDKLNTPPWNGPGLSTSPIHPSSCPDYPVRDISAGLHNLEMEADRIE